MALSHLNLRSSVAAFLKGQPWIPLLAVLICSVGFGAAVTMKATPWLLVASNLLLLAAVFVWGYWTRSRRQLLWAPLTHLHRRQYAEVWNCLMDSRGVPRVAVRDVPAEEELGPSTSTAVQSLLELARVDSHSEVLEIGCGSGRIGLELAPYCRQWTGADVSTGMLAMASGRLRYLQNVRLVPLKAGGLAEFSSNSFDVVYATSVVGHLDEMDRWRYVEEAFRILRPGGRLLFDNIDVESDSGWSMFLNDVVRYQKLERPPYMPRFSTSSELMNYAKRAGFEEVVVHRRSPILILISVKRSLEKVPATATHTTFPRKIRTIAC